MLVKFFATYRPLSDYSQKEVPPEDTVLDLLNRLVTCHPAFKNELLSESGIELGSGAIVLVNGRHIQHLDGVSTKLTDDDVVSIFPLVAGG